MPVESAKYREAEEGVPEELRDIYREMVQHYEFLTWKEYGKGYVAYKVLAKMVLAGWRPSAQPHKTSELRRQGPR